MKNKELNSDNKAKQEWNNDNKGIIIITDNNTRLVKLLNKVEIIKVSKTAPLITYNYYKVKAIFKLIIYIKTKDLFFSA